MPDSGIQPPYLDSSQYPAYLDLQKKQMLAQALGGVAQQTSQTPADWNSMRVVPKKSAFSTIAALASALGAGAAQKAAFGAQQNYMSGLMGQPQAASSPPQSAAPSQMPPSQGSPAPAQPPAQDPNAMLLVPGNRQMSQMYMQMMGPQKYAEVLATRNSPTDLQKTLTAAGISPEAQKPILLANVQKQNYVAPLDLREGGMAFDPLTQKPVGYNPKVPAGSMPQMGPGGMPTAITQIPGAAAATQANTQAETLGKTAGQYNVLPTAGGGSTVVGGPPMGRGAQAPRVGQPSPLPGSTPQGSGWASMPKLPVSSAIGAPDAYTEGRLKAAGTKDAELSTQFGNEANLADQKLQYNIEARKSLPNAEVGPLSEWMTENRAKLLEFGVPESLVPGTGSITPTMELNKNLKQSALQGARAIFGSRMTQNEVQLQHEELSPSPSMTREAITSLMHQDDIKQMYAKQRADDYGKYIDGKGDPLKFEAWYSKNFPLTAFAKQHANDPGMSPAAPPPAAPPPHPNSPVTKQIGGKTYIQQNGKWFEQ